MFISGVNDTGDKLFGGVNDTADKFIAGVNTDLWKKPEVENLVSDFLYGKRMIVLSYIFFKLKFKR